MAYLMNGWCLLPRRLSLPAAAAGATAAVTDGYSLTVTAAKLWLKRPAALWNCPARSSE